MARADWVRITFRMPPEVHGWLLASANDESLNAYLVSVLREKMAASPVPQAEKHSSPVLTVRISEESIQELAYAITNTLRTEAA